MSARRTAAVIALLVGLVGSCSTSSGKPAATGARALSGSVTVFAAASLTGSFSRLAKDFEAAHPGTSVTLSLGGSSTLAQQILAGAPADLFASASAKNMAQVVDKGEASDPVPFARNVAEIAVAPDSAAKVNRLADLAKKGVAVALCQLQVPCGVLAQQVLRNAMVSVVPVTQGLDVKSTLGYVTSGQVDAAIVYVTDVRAAAGKVVGVPIPDDVNASTTLLIAPVRGSHDAALARAFEDYVLSPAGQAVLAEAGFETP